MFNKKLINIRTSFLISATIHCLIFAIFYNKKAPFFYSMTVGIIEKHKTSSKIIFDIRKLIKGQTTYKGHPHNDVTKGKSNLSLEEMAFNTDNTRAVLFASEQVSKAIGTFGDSTGMTKSFDQGGSAIHNYLYSYIGERLHYPKILQKKKIEGNVSVRLVFNKQGIYLPNLSVIRSNSNYLKVLVSRTLKTIFASPLPFNLDFVSHPYFILDTNFKFLASPNHNQDFILSHTFVTGRHLAFLIQDEKASMIGFVRNTEGTIKLGVNPGDILDWFNDNFTAAGKVREIFNEQQLERYKDDPAWENTGIIP